jgi:hypothetical protein
MSRWLSPASLSSWYGPAMSWAASTARMSSRWYSVGSIGGVGFSLLAAMPAAIAAIFLACP